VVLVAVVMALAAVVAAVRGGRPARLAHLPLRRTRLLASATGSYLLGVVAGSLWAPAHAALLVATAGFVGLFVWLNRAVPGLVLIGLGMAANALVVVANGAMPVSLDAAERVGLRATDLRLDTNPRHEAVGSGTRVALLGDVVPFALPGRSQVVSPGDVAVAAGAGLALYAGMTGTAALRPARRRQVAVRASTRASDSTTLGSYS
jgi:hypothetical protein